MKKEMVWKFIGTAAQLRRASEYWRGWAYQAEIIKEEYFKKWRE